MNLKIKFELEETELNGEIENLIPSSSGGSLPSGGTAGQVLTKNSDADGDAGWKDSSGGSYTLPVASSTTLGGVKIGSGISIGDDGTISASGGGSADAVLYTEQTLTNAQKAQARTNIGVDLTGYQKTADADAKYLPLAGGKAKGAIIAPSFQTGNGDTAYFQTKKMRGEGADTSYYHAVDWGYLMHNMVDFHEYGGVWNFYKNTVGKADSGTLVGKIDDNGWNGGAKLSGVPTAPTAEKGTNTTQIATTEFVAAAVPTADITANTAARHSHDNKTALDTITAAKITSWDGKVDGSQGTANAGKFLGIGADGIVVPTEVGGGSEWRKIKDLSVTSEAGVASISITEDQDGNSFSLDEVFILIKSETKQYAYALITIPNGSQSAIVGEYRLANETESSPGVIRIRPFGAFWIATFMKGGYQENIVDRNWGFYYKKSQPMLSVIPKITGINIGFSTINAEVWGR